MYWNQWRLASPFRSVAHSAFLELFRKNRVSFRRRVERDEQLEPLAQVAAGHLARTRIHVDIAAGAVEVQRQSILEGLPRVIAEQLGLVADIRLPAPQGLLQVPAPLVDFAVHLGL